MNIAGFLACVVAVVCLYATGAVAFTTPHMMLGVISWLGGAWFIVLVEQRRL